MCEPSSAMACECSLPNLKNFSFIWKAHCYQNISECCIFHWRSWNADRRSGLCYSVPAFYLRKSPSLLPQVSLLGPLATRSLLPSQLITNLSKPWLLLVHSLSCLFSYVELHSSPLFFIFCCYIMLFSSLKWEILCSANRRSFSCHDLSP